MYSHYQYRPPYRPYGAQHHGMVGVLGSLIGLTTATLQGGARIVRTVVEGTVWHGSHGYDGPCHYPDPCGYHHGYYYHHCYDVECRPRSYPCC